jgi:hypothetical protein
MADPFTCPFCHLVSHNPNDAREKYCGRCHVFVEDVLMADRLMTAAEDLIYTAIINGKRQPDAAFHNAGRDAHDAGVPFGDGPRPLHTVEALCWRIGWNDRALGKG